MSLSHDYDMRSYFLGTLLHNNYIVLLDTIISPYVMCQ